MTLVEPACCGRGLGAVVNTTNFGSEQSTRDLESSPSTPTVSFTSTHNKEATKQL